MSSICSIPLSGANRLSRKKKKKLLLKKAEVFLLSRAVKSNKIDLGRAGFLYEVKGSPTTRDSKMYPYILRGKM